MGWNAVFRQKSVIRGHIYEPFGTQQLSELFIDIERDPIAHFCGQHGMTGQDRYLLSDGHGRQWGRFPVAFGFPSPQAFFQILALVELDERRIGATGLVGDTVPENDKIVKDRRERLDRRIVPAKFSVENGEILRGISGTFQSAQVRVAIKLSPGADEELFKGREHPNDSNLRQESLGTWNFLYDILPERVVSPRLTEGGQPEDFFRRFLWFHPGDDAKGAHRDPHIPIEFLVEEVQEKEWFGVGLADVHDARNSILGR